MPTNFSRQARLHVARELHGVGQRLVVVVERVLNALAHHAAALALDLGVERPQQHIAAERQRQLVGRLEPAPQIDDAVEALAVERQLRFVDDQAGVDACAP